MKIFCTILFLLAYQCFAFAQHTIKGKVLDALTKEGLPFATVFINGTTNGTVTEEDGSYELKVTQFPAELVVNHLTYETETAYLERPLEKTLHIMVSPKAMELMAVEVEDKNRRAKNLQEFKLDFLGIDRWGSAANIQNEAVIRFSRDYKTRTRKAKIIFKREGLPPDTLPEKSFERPVNLKANSIAPIIVDQPKTGYKIHADLVNFTTTYGNALNRNSNSFFLAYYYFEPYKMKNKKAMKRFQKNRIRAYYHSSLHFFRALYNDQLLQNGYQIKDRIKDGTSGNYKLVDFNLKPYLQYNPENNTLEIVGLKDKLLFLLYYPDGSGYKPIDLNKKRGKVVWQSQIQFQEDRCLIRSNGTIPDLSIGFGGQIAEKKVGALLPDNYEVPKGIK